jgi:transcriptional regulator with XRE-family HTH domain
MSVGERLTRLREEKGFLQRDVADKIGIAPNTLSGYERDLRSPDPKTLIKLANFYSVSVDYLLGTKEVELSNIYLSLAKEAEKNGIDPEDIKLAIETIKKLRGGK